MTEPSNQADALDRALDAVIGGDDAAHPVAAAVRSGLASEVAPDARAAHLAAIAAASPERSPEPGWKLASPERSPEPGWKLASPERTPEPDPRVVTPIFTAPSRRRDRRGRRRVAATAVAAMLLLVLGSSSALAAAQGANPGHPLYGVKRASERIALAVRFSPDAKASLHLKFAERRLAEIEALAAGGRDVADIAADFAAELEAAGHAGADDILAKIRERTQRHVAHLTEILENAPESARRGLENAIDKAEQHGEKAEQRRIEKQHKRDRKDRPGDEAPRDETPPARTGENGRGNGKSDPGKGRSK